MMMTPMAVISGFTPGGGVERGRGGREGRPAIVGGREGEREAGRRGQGGGWEG